MDIDPQAAHTGANLVATIMQLIGLFRQERGARKNLTHREFVEWLEHHRHEEIKELITHTYHLQSQIDDLLRQDHAEILSKLNRVNSIVVDILARVEGLGGVAETIIPTSGLSEDSVEILRVFVESGSRHMVPNPSGDLQLDGGKAIRSSDPRFLKDDLKSLVDHGLVSVEHAGKFTLYGLTRRGLIS